MSAKIRFRLSIALAAVGVLAGVATPAFAGSPSPGDAFFTLAPCRALDSRPGSPLPSGTPQVVQFEGLCGVPPGASAVAINATVTNSTGLGHLTLYPADGPKPEAAFVNFSTGQTRSSGIMVVLSAPNPPGGEPGGAFIALPFVQGNGDVDLVLDVFGYFANLPPVAVNDNYAAERDTTLNVGSPGVTVNDTLNGASIVSYGASTGGEQTTIGAATPTSAGGSITLNANGSFSYTPPSGAVNIDDTFKYILQNPSGNSTATVTIGVGKTSQTISFTSTPPSDAKVGGPTYTVTATATSGLPVTFTIDAAAASVCSISGSTVSFIGAGTCVVNANQAGDSNYNPAPQMQQSFPVGKGDQTITFTSTAPLDAKVGGSTYNVTATATSGLTVAFTVDASASSVCSISGSTVSFLTVGTCVINANQAGDANWNPAPQVQQSFPVAKGDQTISFTSTAPSDATVNGPTYNVTATASSGLSVTLTIDASATSVCSISGSTVSFTAAGTCVIDANQAGDANYNPAPQAQQSFAVSLASQTISFTSTAPADAKVGGPTYNVTATATSGLTVTLTIDASASTVCSLSGSTVSFIGTGTCVINANQPGDASYAAAPQVQQTFPVTKNDQTITFTSTAPINAKVAGPTYTVTATATSGLTVTFTIDATASTVCSIAGSTVSFIGAGTCVINANQAGNGTYNPAPQVQQTFPVAKGDQTITFTSTAPVGATVAGPTYTVTATATSGLPVTFTIDASASTVCTIAGSTVSFIGAGTCVINANQPGDANWNPAPQVQQSFPVVKQNQTITFTSTAPVGATVAGPTYTVTATATSGLPVTFTIDASASTVCTIAGSTVSFIGAGTCVINANQAGNGTYNPAPQVQQSFLVVKQNQTITFTSTAPVGATVAGPTYAVTATATSGLPVTFTIDASASTVCTIAGSTVSFIGAGTCVINANQAGNGTYNPAPQVQQSFPVVKQNQTITFTSAAPVGATVAGPTYTVTATATSGLPVTFTIDASASTVCTIAGSTVSFIGAGTCVINANQAGNGTYNPAPQVQQSFLVVKQNQTITFTSTPPAMARIGGPTYTVTATATSGLPVTFAIDPSAAAVCTIAGSTVSFIGGGTCVINANQAGNGTYNPAPQVQQSIHVNFPPQLPNAVTYTTPGNTQLHVAGATLPGVASWTDAVGLLAKSGATDPDNGPGSLSVVAASGVTGNGGNYSIFADGSFTFVPGTGFTGADSFTFQVTDTLDATTGTVNVTVGQRVWYIRDVIDANNAAGGDGRSTNAFDSIAAFNAATTNNGDIIYVFEGNTGTTPHVGSISLKDGQKLWGQGIALNVPGFGTPLVAAANKARIRTTGASTDVVSVPATAGSRSNVEIRGLDLEATGATSNAIDVTASGGNTVGITISNNNIRGATAEGIDLNAGATAAFSATVQSNTVTSAGNGIDTRVNASGTATVTTSSNMITSTAGNAFDARTLAGASALRVVLDDSNVAAAGNGIVIDGSAAGTTTITGFANNVVDGSTVGTGISITSAIFDGTAGAPFTPVNGGTTVIGASGNGVGLGGMVLAAVLGDLSFTDLDIFNESGTGLGVTSTGAINAGAGTGFRIGVTANVATIDSNGGPAVAVNNASFNLPNLNFLRSTNSPSNGLSLVNAFGGAGATTLSANSGQISDPVGASGTAVNISGGNGNITLGIPVTNTSGNAVVVTSRTSDTVSFTGAINETGSGISLTNNAGATNSFSGGITANTGANPAFTATGPGPLATSGGTVTVTGSGNTLKTTSGTALTVTATTIGATDLNFQCISAGRGNTGGSSCDAGAASGTPANGILLNNTGTSGGLKVTGTGVSGQGGNGTGGLIQNTTSHGISLATTREPAFANMTINNTAGSGINGTAVTDFTFDNGTITNSGTGGGVDTANIAFGAISSGVNNLNGVVVITDSLLNTSRYHGIDIYNEAGTISTITVTGNSLTSATGVANSQGTGIRVQANGSAGSASVITTGTFSNNTVTNFPMGAGIEVQGGNAALGPPAGLGDPTSGVNMITISGNAIAGSGTTANVDALGSNAIQTAMTGTGNAKFFINGNGTVGVPLRNFLGIGISCSGGNLAVIECTVSNNVIDATANIASSSGMAVGSQLGVGQNGSITALIENNSISGMEGNGILAGVSNSGNTGNFTIRGNTVGNPTGGVRPGIRVESGSASGDTTLCLDMHDNASGASGGHAGLGIRKQGSVATTNDFGIVGLVPSPATCGQAEDRVSSLNPGTNPGTVVTGSDCDGNPGSKTLAISGSNYVSCIVVLP